jgi:hypothetical protein
MVKTDIHACPLEYISWDTDRDNNSLQVSWHDQIPDRDIGTCIELIHSLLKAVSVQKLLLNGSKMKDSCSWLNWRVIEHCWQTFCENGGEKIVMINDSRSDKRLEEEYINIIKEYEIPINLEFSESVED